MTFDTKTKELIAIGSSIAANCQPCLEYHLKIAARFVKSKSAIAMDEFAREIISDSKKLSEESGQEKSSKSSNLCCG
ncbi:MAG: carboxymuconolactone decarboxylase family protein [Candidatus Methanoperedens sp.]|nr:carboxymuconolactone decarboxylase family protein [Candidatus Methanoperedens sp.]